MYYLSTLILFLGFPHNEIGWIEEIVTGAVCFVIIPVTVIGAVQLRSLQS